jgi:putative transposase
MALPKSALSELLEAVRAGEGVDLIRDSVRLALQELIELEATERIGLHPMSGPRTAPTNATATGRGC